VRLRAARYHAEAPVVIGALAGHFPAPIWDAA